MLVERLTQEYVLPAGVGEHGRQLGHRHRAQDREQPAKDPQSDQQAGRLDPLGHDRQPKEDPRADHRAHHEHRGVEQAEVALQLASLGHG